LLFVGATDENDSTSVVFAEVFALAPVFFQRLYAFWTVNHLRRLTSRIGDDDVKLLWIRDSDVNSTSGPQTGEDEAKGN